MDEHQDKQKSEAAGATLVQSLSRGLNVLAQFTAQSRTLSLSELSRKTGLHKATVHRFVKTLESEGYLVSVDPGCYTIGPGLGLGALRAG